MKLRNTIVLSIIAFAALSSCKSQKEIVEKTEIKEIPMKSTIGDIYFKAVGTEPFWGLEVSERDVKFTHPDSKENLVFPNIHLEKLEENKKLTYMNKTHSLTISIIPGECSDGMSEQRYSHKVSLELIETAVGQATEYNGCAMFMADPKLTKIWILKTMQGNGITKEDFANEMPYLDFIAEKSMFAGFGGCNSINGKMKVNTGNRIQFMDITSTKMMCEKDNQEPLFLGLLSKVGAYKFDGDALILMDAQYVPIATFQKR